MELKQYQGALEAILFAHGEPIGTDRLAQALDLPGQLQQLTIEGRLHRVLRLQGIHPPGEIDPELDHREGIQQRPQKLPNALGIQALAVRRHHGAVFLVHEPLFQGHGSLPPGLPAIDHHQEGLARGLHITDGPMLRLYIILPGDVRNGAVGGDHQAQGGMALHDLFGAQLRRLGHGDLLVIPGGGDHPGLALLLRPHGPGDHVAHGVDHADAQAGHIVRGDLHRLLRHKLRLGGHNGLSGAALGKLISRPLRPEGVLEPGDHQCLHDPLDQGGFSRPHRPHHADIDVPAGPGGDLCVNTFHSQPPTPAGVGSCHGLPNDMSLAASLFQGCRGVPSGAQAVYAKRSVPEGWRAAGSRPYGQRVRSLNIRGIATTVCALSRNDKEEKK